MISGGGGGSSTLSGELVVTNDDSAIGDALGITYPDGTQISSVIADILAPQNAYVENYNLQLSVP